MKRFCVDMTATIQIGVTVEAENEEQAREKAELVISDKAIIALLNGVGPDDASAEIDDVEISDVYEES
jgi:hypothetical protein